MASESKESNAQWTLAAYPDGQVTADHLAMVSCDDPAAPADGEVLLKATYISVDPYMRGRMKKGKHYMSGFELNQPITGTALATVVESKFDGLKAGDLVYGFFPMIKYFTAKGPECRKVDVSLADSPSAYLGVLGLTGLSAYFPVMEIAEPKEGQVAFVTGAAGAVGSVVGQLLKINGCRVIGSAGSDEKVAYLKSIGFDAAFNYKTTDAREALTEFSEDGFDIYWDNVGGEMLDLALDLMKARGRIVCCGMISQYNKKPDERYGVKNLMLVVGKQLRMEGFLLNQYLHKAGEGVAALAGYLGAGKLKHRETIVEGFENVADAFISLFQGKNIGKMVVKVL